MTGIYSLLKTGQFESCRAKGAIAWIKCVSTFLFWDEDNFIKSVRELGTEDIVASFGLTSSLAFFQVDFFSLRNLFLWKTKKISSSGGKGFLLQKKRISFVSERTPLHSPALRLHQNHSLIEIPEKKKELLTIKFGIKKIWILNENSWQWRPQPSSAAWPRAEESFQNLKRPN